MKDRFNGVLLHVSSLPSEYGIGALDESAFSFVDFLSDAGVDFWQTLPVNPTSFGDSPYQSPSAFAGNPYFIDIKTLYKRGLLTKRELDGAKMTELNYAKLFKDRIALLRIAFSRFEKSDEFLIFEKNNAYWLDDYAYFMALKVKNNFVSFDKFPKNERSKSRMSAADFEALRNEADFWKFLQFEFNAEMRALKNYAASKGVSLIGDIPIYVAYDSADVWARPELFRIDKRTMKMTEVAGVPPDYFSETGQLWGNPLYNFSAHKKDNYEWWHKRLSKQLEYFDMVRIDHFRAFESYYAVPADADNAINGRWIKGPGTKVFEGIDVEGKIIAEDLGLITDKVRRLVKRTGFPGMKVFQFAFDGKSDNEHLPKNVKYNTVYYTGTHDNDTLKGWYESLSDSAKEYVRSVLDATDEDVLRKAIKSVMRSRAKYAVVPMQDYLFEGDDCRMNTPGGKTGNWLYRLPANYKKSLKTIKSLNKNRTAKVRNIK